MRPIVGLVVVIVCSFYSAPYIAEAAPMGVPLASVAARANLQYHWLATERAVQLSGPGLVLVIRPGANLYEVNDHVEVAAIPPVYGANDIYVSAAVAETHRAAGIAGVARLLPGARGHGAQRASRKHDGHSGAAGEHRSPRSAPQGPRGTARNGRGAAVGTRSHHTAWNALIRSPQRPAQPQRHYLQPCGNVSSDRADRFRLLPQQLHSRARDIRSRGHVGERADPGRCAERRRRSSRRSATRRNLVNPRTHRR